MKYYTHHIRDFNNATRHLTRLEKSIYRDLIDLYYETEMPLQCECNANAMRTQCDHHALARKVLANTPEELAALHQILTEFFTQEGDGWHHKRCDEELGKIYEKSDKARASAIKRWAKKGKKKTPDANAMRTHSERNAKAMLPNNPITNTNSTSRVSRTTRTTGKKFTPPTVEEVAEYTITRPVSIDPFRFIDHYTANGWRVGRNPMKDWRAAVRNWEKMDHTGKSPNGIAPGTGRSTRNISLEENLTDTSWAGDHYGSQETQDPHGRPDRQAPQEVQKTTTLPAQRKIP